MGMIVHVNIRSATAMLAMNKFVTLLKEDNEPFFKTTYNPMELPRKAMIKITAYAHVIPILNSGEGSDGGTTIGAVVAANGNKNCLNKFKYLYNWRLI